MEPGPYPSWWADDSIWATPYEGRFAERGCTVLAADSAKIPIPPLEWTSCGQGCEKADVSLGLQRSAVPRLSITVIDGRETPYLITRHPVRYKFNDRIDSGRELIRVVDLDSGHSVAAAQAVREPLRDFCLEPQSFGLSALQVTIAADEKARGDDPYFSASGMWDPPSKSWIWQRPPRPKSSIDGNCARLAFQDGGRTFFFCPFSNSIVATLTPGSSELSLLDELGDDYAVPSYGAAENREMVIWPEVRFKEPRSRIRVWDAEGRGPRTLIESIPGDTHAVGLSPSLYFGATVEPDTGYRLADASQGRFRLWYGPRRPSGEEPVITFSPVITRLPLSPLRIRATDRWIAVDLAWISDQPHDVPRVFPLLVRISDWKQRWFGALGGKEILDFTLTQKYFYTIYTDRRFEGATEVFRYDLAEFESIGLPFE